MGSSSHPLVQLARASVEAYVRDRRRMDAPRELAPEMRGRAGVFVSLHKFGDLRGCIGTIEPVRASVAEEIIDNAISAATRDPRFFPVEPEELPDLEISVDVLTEPEPVGSIKELDPQKYGVIVERGGRRGLLLPALEQVTSAEQQVSIARQKAFIGPDEPVKLYRFEVVRYH
jgi:AmmeMemoRadiSam system protein A